MQATVRQHPIEPELALVSQSDEPGPLDEPGFKFSPTGLTITEGVKFEQWEHYGRKLQLAERGIQWAIGDWLVYGENHWPDKYDQAVEITGYKEGTLMNYATVARAIPPGPNSRRRESLDYTTHVEVASLKPDEQEKLLAKAAGEGLSTRRVRREAEKIKRAGKPRPNETDYVLDGEARTYLDGFMESLIEQEEKIPSGFPSLRMMNHAYRGQVQWQKNRTIETDCLAIVEMFSGKEGTAAIERATDSDISVWLNRNCYFISDCDLDDRLELMVEKKMLDVMTPEKGRQEGRRGVMLQLYRLNPDYAEALED